MSCSRSAIEESPWNNAQIPVVYSILSPNEQVKLYLNLTYKNDIPALKAPLQDAKIYMCAKDSNWVELYRLKEDTCIFADSDNLLHIIKGETYFLKIELSNKILHAQTTVPAENAIIDKIVCYNSQSLSGSVTINGTLVPASYNYLSVNFTLPLNVNYGYTITAYEQQTLGLIDLNGNSYIESEFPCPKDSSTFLLKMITLDPYLKKYQLALSISDSQGQPQVNIEDVIMGTFGGVLPQFNNIENGVGIFGSSVTDSKRVEVITKNN